MDKKPWDLKNTIICRCLFIFHTWQKEPGLHEQIIAKTGKPELHWGLSFCFTSSFQIFIGCCNILIISILSISKNKKAAVIYWVPTEDNVERLLYAKYLTRIILFGWCQNSVIALYLFCMVEGKGSQRVKRTFP